MAKVKINGQEPQTPTIICHETKQGIKCSYDGPVYTNPEKPKPKNPEPPKTVM